MVEAPLGGELIELLDDDIIEVGEEVIELPPPALGSPAVGGLAAHTAVIGVETSGALAPVSCDSPPALEALPVAAPPARDLEQASLAHGDESAAEPVPMPMQEQERAELPVPTSHVAGTHRVVIHTADGQVKRGTVSDLALDGGAVLLACQAGGGAESVPVEHIKAIFFMLPVGEPPPQPEGKKVRVTFRDGRQVAGFSVDYAPESPGFFMVPADARTHTARIWVYRTAVRQVSVS